MSVLSGAGKESSIAVTVRVRPFTSDEAAHLKQCSNEPVFLGDGSFAGAPTDAPNGKLLGKQLRKVINVVDDKMLIFDPPESNPLSSMAKAAFPKTTNRIREHRFVFDRLFDESTSQADVYSQTTKPLIDNILDGYNATVFAYGATGCGKTHTISGSVDDPGIIFLTMKELFERIELLQDTKTVDISLSYLEIYNETIRDLLSPANNGKPMVLREDSEKRISVSNLSSHSPQNVDEVMEMILHGNVNRTMSPTEANATSSRSHAVLQINVTQKARTAELSEAHTFATLSIIDLAGSERASATKNRGERLMEGANINKSLLALGNCINALCDPRRRGHVPYRDSKLTRLLKFSLGGNCKTVMIVCVSPSSAHYDETLNTLKYADRAKRIKTKVIRNETNLDRHVGSYLKMITEQRAEIQQLRDRETKAIAAAMQRHEKTRKLCFEALEEAKTSVQTTIDKTSESRVQRSKAMARLRILANQIAQVAVMQDAVAKIFDMFEDGDDIAAVERFKSGAAALLQKLTSERDSLQAYCGSLQDQAALSAAINSTRTRLQETSAWTQEDTQHFDIYCELQKQKLENDLLTEAAKEVPIAGSLTVMSHMYFEVWSKLMRLKNDENYIITLEAMLNKLAGSSEGMMDYKNFSDATLNLNFSMPPPPPPVSASAVTGGSGGLMRRRSGFKRPFTTKRHSVVVRSPVKKATKRVRWEDDSSGSSDVSMINSRSESPAPSKNNTLRPLVLANGGGASPHITTKSTSQHSEVATTNLDESANVSVDISTSPSVAPSEVKRASSRFGVKSELRRKPPLKPSVLGMNKKSITRIIEKENLDYMDKSSAKTITASPNANNMILDPINNSSANITSSAQGGVISPNRKLGMPLRVTVPTAASSMKHISRDSSGGKT